MTRLLKGRWKLQHWGVLLTLAGPLVAIVGAIADLRLVVLVGLVASLCGEVILERRGQQFKAPLRLTSLGMTARILLRFAAFSVYWSSAATGATRAVVLVAVACAIAIRIADVAAAYLLRRPRNPPIVLRNTGPEDTTASERAPRLLSGPDLWRSLPTEALIIVPPLLFPSSLALVVVCAVLAVVIGVAFVLWSLRFGLRWRREPLGTGAAAAQRYLDAAAPQVVLYFSGDATSAYQVNVWLSTLERLGLPTVILLRERSVLPRLKPTSVPILCIPGSVDFMSLQFDSVRVAYYTANVGKNIHLLRLPGICSTFIGHGDSDKNASFNPFTRVYDEVWVAGLAGRDRYARAQVGVRDEQVVEVGRPQLDAISGSAPLGPRAAQDADRVPTVLYAPTWEGWNEQQAYSSIETIGEELVASVLASPRPVRLVYKPHPYTGRRSASVRAAHERIVAAISAANDRAGRTMPARGIVEPGSSALETEQATMQRDAAFFAELAPDAHAVIRPGTLDIYGCFNAADALVTDISSVLSDFVATGRPYAVSNPQGLSVEAFHELFPSTTGATVLSPGNGVADFLEMVTGARPDALAEARAEARNYLLGPADVPSIDRFREATLALAARADAQLATPGAALERSESADDEAMTPDELERESIPAD